MKMTGIGPDLNTTGLCGSNEEVVESTVCSFYGITLEGYESVCCSIWPIAMLRACDRITTIKWSTSFYNIILKQFSRLQIE